MTLDDRTAGVDDEPPFTPSDPPHWVARGLAYVLMSLAAVMVLAAAVVNVPETVSGRFVLVPERGLDPLRAPRKGIADAVRVTEGQRVATGDTLFVIRSEPAGDRYSQLRMLQEQLRAADERAANARRQYESQQLSDQEDERTLRDRIASLGRSLAIKRRQYALSESLAAGLRTGLATKAVSPMEYSQPQLAAEQQAVDIEQTEGQRQETQLAIDKLHHDMNTRRIEYLEQQRALAQEEANARIQLAPLLQELGSTTIGSRFAVVAPCAGTVLRLRVRAAEAVVAEGDALGEIACAGDRLRAELTVPQSGLSLVRAGQGVKLRYDAFPYQRFGVRFGVVRWIGPGTVDPGDSGAFRALVDLDGATVDVRGQPRPLLVGMGGIADIVVGTRTLVSYAFEPIRQLRENMAAAPHR